MMFGYWLGQASRLSGMTGTLVGLTGVGAAHGSPQIGATAGAALVCGALWRSHRQMRQMEDGRRQDARLRSEMAAYVALSLPRAEERGTLGRTVAHAVSLRSTFARAALLLRDASGLISVAGSAGMDDLTVQSLDRWAATWCGDEETARRAFPGETRAGDASYRVRLERRQAGERSAASSLACSSVLVMPLRTARGIVGVLVVSAEPRVSALPILPPARHTAMADAGMPLGEVLVPLEALAARLTTHVGLLEREPARKRRSPVSIAVRAAAAGIGSPAAAEEVASRRTLDAAEELQPAPMSLRRLLELTAPPGTKVPKSSSRVTGFMPASKW